MDRAGTILHCIPSMSGGGAERQLAYLAAELRAFGWTVHVALWRRGPNWARLERSGAVIHEMTARHAYDPALLSALRRVLSDAKPDVVQTWLLQMDILGGAAALLTRTPWIVSERSEAGAYPLSLKNVIRSRLVRRADAVVSNSPAGDDYWRTRLSQRGRRFIVPNAIPLDEIAAVPGPTAGPRSGEPVVMFAGRLAAEKNIAMLLAGLSILWTRRRVQVWCFGEGPLKAMVDRWASTLPADRGFHAKGYAPDLWPMMKQASVLVSPSVFEGAPNVVLEAMACGVPLVVSDIPAHRELLDAESAMLVDASSPVLLADAIDAVLQDPIGAARRAAVALRRAARFDLRATARRYDDMYRDVISQRVAG